MDGRSEMESISVRGSSMGGGEGCCARYVDTAHPGVLCQPGMLLFKIFSDILENAKTITLIGISSKNQDTPLCPKPLVTI